MTHLQLSFAQHYHERTKYSPAGLAAKAQSLDWSTQPSPYKQYPLGALVDLQPYLAETEASQVDTVSMAARLSRLLINTYGLTARVPSLSGEPFYLRAAPSAGGLYPAEIYLISRGTSLLPAGLYNYQVRSHGLVRFWDEHVWQTLQKACFWHPALEQTHLAMVISAVFFRSAWRYQDRAYRRIYLDTGHLLGNLELASSLADYRPHLIGGFADTAVNQLLYLNAPEEAAIAVVALADLLQVEQNLPSSNTTLASGVHHDYPELPDGELLPYLHQVSQIPAIADSPTPDPQPSLTPPEPQADKYNFPFCLKASTVTSAIEWGESLQKLENTILRRRSTRHYSGLDLTFAELKSLLHFAYQPEAYAEQGLDRQPDYFDLSLIETFIAASAIVGLDEGCYYYAPQAQELRQVRFKNFRRDLHYLCLGQDLGRDAAAVLFHTADLKKAVARYGDRAYRYLHMDAGHLGQRLNLAAIRLGLGVSGIGGFFDDQVNEILGIPGDEAVLYITTLGQPRQRQ
ncbi:SagB/ThcOx family dehydrogenase [Almyronema epifaneia]|uniref:SagB/ThcOx family dehydrogenase n=1 Tax=Almyronema epifaneia S1 TaxID=2991925 RepID=A0ABW6IDU7_9CYAN